MLITWDAPKRVANLEKHGFDFVSVDEAFFEAALIGPAKGGRFFALGILTGQPVVAIFDRLGTEALSLISLRPASRKERGRL